MPNETDQAKAITGLLLVCTVVAVIVLVIDMRIKAAILEAAQKLRVEMERFERKYFNGQETLDKPNPASIGVNTYSAWGNGMAGTAGVAPATSLKEYAQGFGPPEGKNLNSVPRAGSDSVEVQEGDGEV